MLFELEEAYADLISVRGALAVSERLVSLKTQQELKAVLRFVEGRVYVALAGLSEQAREEAIGRLDEPYGGEARANLEALLRMI